jgi:hypothetical protein
MKIAMMMFILTAVMSISSYAGAGFEPMRVANASSNVGSAGKNLCAAARMRSDQSVRGEGKRRCASSTIELVASVRMPSTRRLPWSPAPSRQSLSKI